MTRRLAERYLLGDEIGSGGTSRVHTAFDERLRRQVAVKLLDVRAVATADPAGRERFLREGRTSAAFAHPNAVTVFDAGEDSGDLYIVMELVEGVSLAQHLARSGPLPIDDAVTIAGQVLAALSSAHAAGIVHRDVKPANVLLGSDGSVKLADFGIARRFDHLDESVTATGVVMGTPRYLAPEQALGAETTPATDVYTMGIVLFEMLTGRTPFDADSMVAAALAQQSQPAPDVLDLRPEVPVPLAEVVARSLVKDPAARYVTAVEMAEALDAARAHGDLTSATAPQAAVATQVVGARSGETQVLPSPPRADRRHDRASDGSTRMTAAVMLAVLALVVGAVVLATMSGSSVLEGQVSDDVAVTDAATPPVTEPVVTEPVVTEPVVTDPVVTEPVVTEPVVTEPVVTEPVVRADPRVSGHR
jgi:eukaryotic-like serine/threonine-protein kinase